MHTNQYNLKAFLRLKTEFKFYLLLRAIKFIVNKHGGAHRFLLSLKSVYSPRDVDPLLSTKYMHRHPPRTCSRSSSCRVPPTYVTLATRLLIRCFIVSLMIAGSIGHVLGRKSRARHDTLPCSRIVFLYTITLGT